MRAKQVTPDVREFANCKSICEIASTSYYKVIRGAAAGAIRTMTTATGSLLYHVEDAKRYVLAVNAKKKAAHGRPRAVATA